MKTGHLYLLVDADAPHVKIGIAMNVLNRIAALPERIDLGRSFCVRCHKSARSVEKAIHLLFSESRITSKPSGDGHTEWFSIECMDAVRDFIANHSAKFGVSPWIPVSDLQRPVPVKSAHKKDSDGYPEGWTRITEEDALRRLVEDCRPLVEFMRKDRPRFRIDHGPGRMYLMSIGESRKEFQEMAMRCGMSRLISKTGRLTTLFCIEHSRINIDGAAVIDLSVPALHEPELFGASGARIYEECQQMIRDAASQWNLVGSPAEADAKSGRRDSFFSDSFAWIQSRPFWNIEDVA